MKVQLKEPWEISQMRDNGRRLAELAEHLKELASPGVSTMDLDRVAEERIRGMGALPSFKGYAPIGFPPFPATICASPNAQVVHGVPTELPLEEGDIVTLDLGMVYGGYHVDMAVTVPIGRVKPEASRLLDATAAALYEGVAQALPGGRIGDIGHAIESSARQSGLGVVRQYVGHGIGRRLHERPSIPNYGKPRTGDLIKVGMCLAIEPMLTLGTHRTKTLGDGWTVVTADGSFAAHFEHTIAVTSDGPKILTAL